MRWGWRRWTLSGRVAVPAGSRRQMRSSSWRRPRRARRFWGWRSRGGVCASWWATSPTMTSGPWWSAANGCVRSSPPATSRSSGPRRGRSRTIPTATPSWTASRRCSNTTRSGVSPSTSSGRCRCVPSAAPAGRRPLTPSAARRTITNSTACDSSTAATRSATMCCGAWCVPANRRPNTVAALKSIRAARPRHRSRLRHLGQPLGAQSPPPARLGGPQQRPNCASPLPTAPGPTPSKRTSGRCESSS